MSTRQINAFQLKQDGINISSGVRKYRDESEIYLCISNGSLKITFNDGTDKTVNCKAGMAFTFEAHNRPSGVDTVEVVSGSFHIGV